MYNFNQPNYFGYNYNQPQTQQNSNVNWIDVDNINDINNITVQPNTTAWIKFNTEPIIATKTSDSMGICTTKYFKIEPIELTQQQNNLNTENFVTKDDLQNFMQELNAKFDSLQNNQNKANSTNNTNK